MAPRVLLLLVLLGGACAAPVSQLPIPQLSGLPAVPSPLLIPDWTKLARAYLTTVADVVSTGPLLPIAWLDKTGYNFPGAVLAMPSYVGGVNVTASPSEHEALTAVGTCLTASLVGVDATALPVKGLGPVDAYSQLRAFFAARDGAGVFGNDPVGNVTAEFWYELWPTASAYMAAAGVGVDVTSLDALLLASAQRWAQAQGVLGTPPSYNYTGFNFSSFSPYSNGRYVQLDGAAGAAFVFVQAGARFPGVRPGMVAAAWDALSFLATVPPSTPVLYEVLAPLGAYTLARLLGEEGVPPHFPDAPLLLPTLLAWAVTPYSPLPLSRPDWGVINDKWAGVDVGGLAGSTTDSSGYAFALNTYTFLASLLPVARYNASYARVMARYGLNAASSARLFLRDYTPPGQQDDYAWSAAHDAGGGVGYEGVRHFGPAFPPYTQPGPWGTGDAKRNGHPSNLGLYGGSYIGLMAALVKGTNVTTIPAFDLLATDWHHGPAWPTLLLANPTEQPVAVLLPAPPTLTGDVSMYDTVSGTWLVRNTRVDALVLTLQPDQAVVAVVSPAGEGEGRDTQDRITVGGRVVDYSRQR